MAAQKKTESAADKVARCIRAREHGRKMYARSDRLLSELVKEIGIEQAVKLNESGKTARIKDKLQPGQASAFCPAVFRRYEIEISDD